MIAMFMFESFTTEAFVAWYFCNLFVNVCAGLAVIDHHRLNANRQAMWKLMIQDGSLGCNCHKCSVGETPCMWEGYVESEDPCMMDCYWEKF